MGLELMPVPRESTRRGRPRWLLRSPGPCEWVREFDSLKGIDEWLSAWAHTQSQCEHAVTRFREICRQADSATLEAIERWVVYGWLGPLTRPLCADVEAEMANPVVFPLHWRTYAARMLAPFARESWQVLSMQLESAWLDQDRFVLSALPQATCPSSARPRL
jgi:hypothetical protein